MRLFSFYIQQQGRWRVAVEFIDFFTLFTVLFINKTFLFHLVKCTMHTVQDDLLLNASFILT